MKSIERKSKEDARDNREEEIRIADLEIFPEIIGHTNDTLVISLSFPAAGVIEEPRNLCDVCLALKNLSQWAPDVRKERVDNKNKRARREGDAGRGEPS